MTELLGVLDLLSAALLAPMLLVAIYNLLTAPRLEAGGAFRQRLTGENLAAGDAPAPAHSDSPPLPQVWGRGRNAAAYPGNSILPDNGSSTAPPRASLLIPARNEAENLARTLPPLLELAYPDLEILVLDDGSEDGTAAIVQSFADRSGGRLRLLTGTAPPSGWVGKNWACHQLAEHATGETLIFCDADVSTAPDAVRQTVALLQAESAGAVTCFPRQQLGSWAEHALVPLVVNLPILALLPLRLVSRLRSPALSAANGQWLAFTRQAYEGIGGHAAVRGEVVEDVALGRRVKEAGFRLVPALATTLLAVRMYSGLSAAREGFRKNLYGLTGYRVGSFAMAFAVFLLMGVYPWLGALRGSPAALGLLLLLVLLRVLGALLFRHGWTSVLLHPVGSVLLAVVALESLAAHRAGNVQWKGRRIRQPVAVTPPSAPRW